MGLCLDLFGFFEEVSICSTLYFLLMQVCHARVSTPSAQLGLPELQLGIIPGMGGTLKSQHGLACDIISSHTSLCVLLTFGLNMSTLCAAPVSFGKRLPCSCSYFHFTYGIQRKQKKNGRSICRRMEEI